MQVSNYFTSERGREPLMFLLPKRVLVKQAMMLVKYQMRFFTDDFSILGFSVNFM